MAAPVSQQSPQGTGRDPWTARPADRTERGTRSFWDRVTEGLELHELWLQFKTEAQTGYRLYSRELPDRETDLSRGQRFRANAKVLFWAILNKLSPARRIVLLVAVFLLIFPVVIRFSRDVSVDTAGQRFFAGLLLLGLLLMEIADRVTLKRDLQIAREIQLWLVPEKAPSVDGLDIAFYNRPANTVAGDYYDVFRRNPECAADTPVLLIVADVAGKSLPAALLMATLQASLHTLAGQCTTLNELVVGLNRYASDHSRGGQRFTTAFIAEYDPKSGVLSYINAGHNAPILQKLSGAMERLDIGGVPLGIDPQVAYASGTAILSSGDTLMIFTDGLPEAINDKDEEYGEERLINSISGHVFQTAADTVVGLIRPLDLFVGMTPQHDDMTCMVLHHK